MARLTSTAQSFPGGTHGRPFVKWAGGKTQMLDALVARSPQRVATYFEPCLGGGALFFALASGAARPSLGRAVLNDLNPELMLAFTAVRDELEQLTRRLETLERRYLPVSAEARAEFFYAVRDQQPEEPVAVAARLIFLNKTCYNGLYRVNRRGRFNVPHGRYKQPRILDCENLLAASRALQESELLCVDFEQACEDAASGDFVYFDPPFYPMSSTSSFTAYTQSSFGREDQLRLKWCIDGLSERGVNVMLSNSPHEFVLGMYLGSHYRAEELPARRVINSRGDRRGGSTELVITNYEPDDPAGAAQSTK